MFVCVFRVNSCDRTAVARVRKLPSLPKRGVVLGEKVLHQGSESKAGAHGRRTGLSSTTGVFVCWSFSFSRADVSLVSWCDVR